MVWHGDTSILLACATKLCIGITSRSITHVRHLGTVESIHPQDVVSRLFIDNNSPVRVLGHLVVIGDDVGDGSTRVLDLNSTIGREGSEGH